MVVVLPAPLGPSRANTSPRSTSNVTSSTATSVAVGLGQVGDAYRGHVDPQSAGHGRQSTHTPILERCGERGGGCRRGSDRRHGTSLAARADGRPDRRSGPPSHAEGRVRGEARATVPTYPALRSHQPEEPDALLLTGRQGDGQRLAGVAAGAAPARSPGSARPPATRVAPSSANRDLALRSIRRRPTARAGAAARGPTVDAAPRPYGDTTHAVARAVFLANPARCTTGADAPPRGGISRWSVELRLWRGERGRRCPTGRRTHWRAAVC